MAVTWDAIGYADALSASSVAPTVTIAAAHSNYCVVVLVAYRDASGASVSSISGAGGTYTKFGATLTGNGTFKGECWKAVPSSTGAQAITVTMTGSVDTVLAAYAISLYGVDPTTSLAGLLATISGNQVSTVTAGDVALSGDFDSNNNRTVTGCTSSTDETNFNSIGHSEAHCTSSPTSTFTWSGFDANSIAIGVTVKQVSASGHGPLLAFKRNSLVV